jgi:hypothetical protein
MSFFCEVDPDIVPSTMRVRLTKPLFGVSGGIRLSQFLTGVIYDLDPKVAAHLIMLGAEFVAAGAPAAAVTLSDEALLTHEQLTGGITVMQSIDRADDRPPRRRRK